MSARQRRRPWVMQATALYDYAPEESDELALIEGQRVRVLQVQDDGWWLGYVADDPERVGLFPSNYVRQEHESPSPQQQQRIVQQHQHQHQQQMQRSLARPREADDEEDEGDEVQDDEQQQRQQQRTYQPPQISDGYKNLSRRYKEDDDDDQDENEAAELAAPAQQRMVSVLQLKRSLADAERASDAARTARLQAERVRIQQQRRRPLPRTERSVEDEEEEDSDNTARREQDEAGAFHSGRQQRHRAPPDEEDDKDEDVFQYNQRRNVDEYGGDDNDEREEDEEEEEEEEEEEQPDSNEIEGDGSFSVPAIQGSRMKEVISAYQTQQESGDGQEEDDGEEALAASRIAHEYRRHRIHQQSKHHQRSFVERQNVAALAIQRWMLRTSSQQRMRNQRILERDQDARDEQEQQEDTEAAAAARIQSWIRQLLAHFRWKEHIERERVTMLKRKRVKMLQLEQEARQKAEEEQRFRQEKDEQELQQGEQERKEFERKQRHVQHQQLQRPAASNLHHREPPIEEKARKKIMKKEAVDLVKVLVKKQLDEKLREHDEKMGELQRLVTTLQDVIRKQSEMIIQSSAEPLPELQIAQKSTKFMQTLGKQQQQQSIPTHSVKQPMESSSSSTSVTSPASTLPAATAKESFIPKPPSRSSLPQLGSNVVKLVKPSGIKPPRNSTDIQSTKLPVLANARQPSSIPVKR